MHQGSTHWHHLCMRTTVALTNSCYCLFYCSHCSWCGVVSHDFGLHFHITKCVKYLFMCLLVICMSSSEKKPFEYFAHYIIGLSFSY